LITSQYDRLPVRVAVIDIGTNSTRLLVAETDGGGLAELERRSQVTGLGRGVDTSGNLADDAIERVCSAVAGYLEIAREVAPAETVALATSAVRDSSNGDAFLAELRERFALGARTIDGSEEARLTYRGATHGRNDAREGGLLVVDIGGGSTELIVGDGPDPDFHVSMQLGVIRHSERHVHADPPTGAELEELGNAVRREVEAARRRAPDSSPAEAVAVAGTPTTLAAIALGLEPYDAEAVEGHVLELAEIQKQCSRLAAMPLAERCEVPGMQRERAPTIVAGIVILIGVLREFGLDRVTVSERDILWGAALEAASGRSPSRS
jgi:exopolyphosphatase / guanosine-5'-triphosphate,3'-diphosphate pyrophosphatase